jgi:tRNA (guanosine-2'-O-)-methyltransferase
MRRKTPGVIGADHIVPAKIAEAERHDPLRAIRLLEPLVLDRRRERLLSIIDMRLESVQVLFDAPHDPHNGAAVVRSCEVFGIQFVHVIERREPFLMSPTVTRGAEKWIDLRRYRSVDEATTALRAQNLELVGAHPDGDLDPSDLAKLPRIALVLGNERDGIGSDLAKACTRRVRVPMRGFSESLNVSVSAAILLAAATADRKGDLSEADRNRVYARGLYFTVGRADDVLKDE